jgi:hypothetical protein
MPLLLETLVVWLEFGAIFGRVLSSMFFILFLYINYLIMVVHSMGERITSMRRIEYGVFPLILIL